MACQKHRCLPKHASNFTGRHLLAFQLIKNLKPSLCTFITRHDTAEHNNTNSQAQDTTKLRPTVFLTARHGILTYLLIYLLTDSMEQSPSFSKSRNSLLSVENVGSLFPVKCPYPVPARSSPYPYILHPEDPS